MSEIKYAQEKAKKAVKAGQALAAKRSKALSAGVEQASKLGKEEWRSKLRNWKLLTIVLGSIAAVLALSFIIDDGWGKPIAAFVPTISGLFAGFLTGFVGGLCCLAIKRYGPTAIAVLLVLTPLLMFIIGDVIFRDLGMMAGSINFIWGVVVGAALLLFILASNLPIQYTPKTKLPNVFGSSRWAKPADLVEAGLLEQNDGSALYLGKERETGEEISYAGDMHALTVAPTRTGKGAAAIIPNLKRLTSSILVIDPKGENARATWKDRLRLGQTVHVVDPWGITREPDQYFDAVPKEFLSHYNPLDALDPNDPDIVSDAMQLAEALVTDQSKDPFWSNEAKAMIQGFILHTVTCPTEEDRRNLGRVRDIICLPIAPPKLNDQPAPSLKNTLDEIIILMKQSDHKVVRQAAFRFEQKEAKERASILSTVQANTHFLDSPKIRDSVFASNFLFGDLKTNPAGVSVYLVLPLDRLVTFNRWLRLLLSSALIDMTRTKSRAGAAPVRVFMDEFAALQKLDIVETAYGTMAGMGVQLWAFTQDLGQLMRLYGEKTWQTFMSNAGVFQYFGSRDHETAKYAEHLCGITTMKKASFSFGKNWSSQQGGSSSSQGGSSSWSSTRGGSETENIDDVSRPLAYADQMMTLRRDLQLIFVENNYPIIALKDYHFKTTDTDDDDPYPLEREPKPPETPNDIQTDQTAPQQSSIASPEITTHYEIDPKDQRDPDESYDVRINTNSG